MLNVANQKMGRGSVHRIPPQYLDVANAEPGSMGVIDRGRMYEFLVANDLLRRDEAREIDEALVRVADRDRMGIADLQSFGLVKNLRNIGVTIYQVDRHSAVEDGKQSMSITDLGDRDQIEFTPTLFPVPVSSSQFRLDRRYVSAGRTQGAGVDVSNVEEHTRAVLRRLEETLFNGNSNIVIDGNALQGYTNLTANQDVSISGSNWDDLSAGDREEAVADVINMKAALTEDGYRGPFVLYVPENWESTLDDDYKANSERTLRERILAISGVDAIRVVPELADDNALLVQMTRSVVEYAVGQPLTTVTWDYMGGLAQNWAVMEVSTFAIKTAEDEEGSVTSGVAHLS